jgi:hypothetical protein
VKPETTTRSAKQNQKEIEMNTTFTLKPAAVPASASAPFQAVLRFVRFALRQLARRDDLAALRYASGD